MKAILPKMLHHIDRSLTSDRHRSNLEPHTKHIPHSDFFASSLKELHQRISKVIKLTEPYSLIYKELEDILLFIETKESYFAKFEVDEPYSHEKPSKLRDILKKHHQTKPIYTGESLDDSVTEDDTVQNFRKQGRELINEYKSVLGEMKSRNQALKSLYQQPDSISSPQSIAPNQWKPGFLSPTNFPVPSTKFAFSPVGLVSSPVSQALESHFNREAPVNRESPSVKQQIPTYSEVLLNIEKFMRNLDQRTAGQSKRIESITQEIDALKQQMQPYKHISEMRDISDKLEAQRELLQEKFIRENPETTTNVATKQDVQTARLPERKIDPADLAEQIHTKAAQLDEIHNNFDECSKLLVRKRLEHTFAKENGQLLQKSIELERSVTPIGRVSERQSHERFSHTPTNPGDFDVHAALARRELRMKNYQEREERLKRGAGAITEEEKERDGALPTIREDLSMTQTLKRSENQRSFIDSQAVEIKVYYGSKMNSAAKGDDELASTKKSCLSRRGFSSKENSGSKAERRIRFADEEVDKRALKFEEIEVSKPLEDQDINKQYASRRPQKKAALKGEISQLDKEIKLISQLLNSALLSEKISAEVNI